MIEAEEQFIPTTELLQPWSTFVLKTQLPTDILQIMLKITDEIIANPEIAVNKGKDLAGQIKDEFQIENKRFEDNGALNYFLDMVKVFVIQQTLQMSCGYTRNINKNFEERRKEILEDEWYIQLDSMWANYQKDNEYNPIHFHTGCHISTVMYLKIPEYLPSRKSYKNEDGAITFISNSTRNPIWGAPVMTLLPKVGDFFIFPSTQAHCVYPFRTADGKGERRSVAFNASFSSKSINDKNEYLPKTQKSNR